MKKLSILFAVIFALTAGPAMAQDYVLDTPSGDDAAHTMDLGTGTIDVTVGLQNLPEQLVADAVVVTYNHTIIQVTAVEINDDGAGAGVIAGTGPVAAATSTGTGCWDGTMGAASWVVMDGDANTTQLLVATGIVGSCPGGPRDDFLKITFDSVAAGTSPITLSDMTSQVTGDTSGPLTVANDPHTVNINVKVACTTDADCNDGLWCTALQECDTTGAVPVCNVIGVDQCIDGDPCTLDDCAEAGTPGETAVGTCDNSCDEAYVISSGGSTSACCLAAPCDTSILCASDVTLDAGLVYYAPIQGEVITIKNPICLENQPGLGECIGGENDGEDCLTSAECVPSGYCSGGFSGLVGGIQFDLCDDPNCLTCVDCELTERTTMFDCEVMELANGCCRVLMFCKNPGCAINPGICDIVTVVQQTTEGLPDCGNDCIIESFDNIVVSDYDGNAVAGAGIDGQKCPIWCGDICPKGEGTGMNDCGDGEVDILDIMCEVQYALNADLSDPFNNPGYGGANLCQIPRADVPTGTPPNCVDPDGVISILDIMVLIDMALDRQDCCSFVYMDLIY